MKAGLASGLLCDVTASTGDCVARVVPGMGFVGVRRRAPVTSAAYRQLVRLAASQAPSMTKEIVFALLHGRSGNLRRRALRAAAGVGRDCEVPGT